MMHSTDDTDVAVVSLDDRRKIRALETQVEDLTRKLSDALERVKPGLERTTHTECFHSGTFVVAENELEVTCKVCGARMDPYDVLRRIAHREVNFCYTLNGLREESKRLAASVEKLKAQRARLRGQVSKATPDTPLDDIAEAMKCVGADTLLLRKVGGLWGAWFTLLNSKVVTGPATRTIREAVAGIMEVSATTKTA